MDEEAPDEGLAKEGPGNCTEGCTQQKLLKIWPLRITLWTEGLLDPLEH